MEIAAATSLIATKKPQGNLAAQQVKNCQLALTQIKEKLQPCYIDEAQFNLNLAEFIHEESEQKTSMSDMEHSAKKSVTQKIEHVLRTTLHYFRIWKRDVFEFK